MFSKELIIPQDVQLEIAGNKVKVKGTKGELEKSFDVKNNVKLEQAEGKLKVSSESDRRITKAIAGTIAAHIGNMITGVTKGYVYKLKVVYSHFPVTLKVEGDKVLIQNFLGERTPRVAKIAGKVKVEVAGADVTVTGMDIDEVSGVAANIEQAIRISGRDRRIFQDGVWIVSKGE